MFTPCQLWKEIHPHIHTDDTPSGPPCWLWKWIHPRVHTLLVVERDTNSHPHWRYTLRSTLLTVEMNTPCWWWKGIHPHIHTDDTPSSPHCWLWKLIHPHVHTLLVMERDTLTSTLTMHPQVHTVDCGNEYTFMFTPRTKIPSHLHVHCW